MKLGLAIVSVVTCRGVNNGDKNLDGEKRYAQMTDMMRHFNPEFDERKYWAYGCNCLMVGDRPMSTMGFGQPTDALDRVCKDWKDCQKCARDEFGEMCIGELVKYKYGYNNQGVQCKNKGNTCERALCECDAQFAEAHNGAKDAWDVSKHGFFADQQGYDKWDPEKNPSQCYRGGSGDPACCSNSDKTSPFIRYNAFSKQCCADGSVASFGDCESGFVGADSY